LLSGLTVPFAYQVEVGILGECYGIDCVVGHLYPENQIYVIRNVPCGLRYCLPTLSKVESINVELDVKRPVSSVGAVRVRREDIDEPWIVEAELSSPAG